MRARLAVAILGLAGVACVASTPVFPNPSSNPRVTPPSPRPTPAQAGPILLIGDSIMVGAQNEGGIQGLLEEDGWVPEIVAENSKDADWALGQIQQRLSVPRIVVVEMGTNPSPPVRNFAEQVQAIVDALVQRGAKRIIWIPPQARDPTRYAERAQVVRDAASSVLKVSRWPDRVMQDPLLFQDDGLHLTEEGYRELALFLRDELLAL